MACSRWGPLKAPGRYRTLIQQCFPEDEDEYNPEIKALSKLKGYSQTAPHKLPKMGKLLEKMSMKALGSKKWGQVSVAVHVMVGLVEACHDEQSLMLDNMRNVLHELMAVNKPEIQLMGITAFTTFMHYQDRSTYNETLGFVAPIAKVSRDTKSDEIRKATMLAFDKMIEILGSLVTGPLPQMVPSILDCLSKGPKDVEWAVKEFDDPTDQTDHMVACRCLRRLMNLGSNDTVYVLFEATFKYFDQRGSWNGFSEQVMRYIAATTKPHYSYLLFSNVLLHLEGLGSKKDEAKRSLLKIISVLANNSLGTPGPWVLEVVSVLIRNYLHCPEALQETIIKIIADMCAKLDRSLVLIEVVALVLHKVIPEDNKKKPGKDFIAASQNLLRMALKISENNVDMSVTNTFPDQFLRSFALASVSVDSGSRLLVMNIFHTMLSKRVKSARQDDSASDKHAGLTKKMHEYLTKEQIATLRQSLMDQLVLEDTEPNNVLSIYHTFTVMLAEDVWVELESLLPLLFNRQEAACSKPYTITTSRTTHMLILGLGLQIAQVVHSNKLTDYLKKVTKARQSAGLFNHTGLELNDGFLAVSHKKGQASFSNIEAAQKLPEGTEIVISTVADLLGKASKTPTNLADIKLAVARPYHAPSARRSVTYTSDRVRSKSERTPKSKSSAVAAIVEEDDPNDMSFQGVRDQIAGKADTGFSAVSSIINAVSFDIDAGLETANTSRKESKDKEAPNSLSYSSQSVLNLKFDALVPTY